MRASVLMPVFNGGKFLHHAIESILRQTYRDFEFIVIDDASTDATGSIISSYKDGRIRKFANGVNQGLVSCLNRGIELAKGEYIFRMDADDISEPTRIEKQIAFMDGNLSIGIAGSSVRTIKEGKNEVRNFPTDPEIILCRLLFETVLAHPAVVFRKSVLTDNKLRYRQSFHRCEDYDLWVRASRVTKISNISEPLLHYRIHSGQTGQKYGKIQGELIRRIHTMQLNDLGIYPSGPELDLHRSIGKKLPQYRSSYLGEVDQWLAILEEANKRAKIYPEIQFKKTLDFYREGAKKSVVGFRRWLVIMLRHLI